MKEREIQEPFEFTWSVPAEGFRWVRAIRPRRARDTFLVEQFPSLRRRLYKPLRDCTGLFRIFSEVLPTQRGVLEFANEYGQLGGACMETVLIPAGSKLPSGGHPSNIVKGEARGPWQNEIWAMKALVSLWDATRKGETGTLAKWIHWHRSEVSYDLRVDGYHAAGSLASPDDPEILGRFAQGDVVQPASYLLQLELNNRFKQHPAMPRLLWDQRRLEPRITLTPTSLISALWVQFGFAVGGNHSYRTCAACGKWFQVGPAGDTRADAKYCSNACRQRKYRENVASK